MYYLSLVAILHTIEMLLFKCTLGLRGSVHVKKYSNIICEVNL